MRHIPNCQSDWIFTDQACPRCAEIDRAVTWGVLLGVLVCIAWGSAALYAWSM